MKKLIFFIITSFLFHILIAEESNPRILIVPLENQSGVENYNSICTTVDDIVSVSMKLLGQYEVVEAGSAAESGVLYENMKSYAEENSLDNIMYGSLKLDDSGKIIMKISLFETSSDKIVLSREEKADNFFEIFDVSDRLIAQVLGFFRDGQIGFGSLQFINSGEPGDYRVYINYSYIGENLTEIPKSLTGSYHIVIKQNRFNQEKTVYRSDFLLEENENLKIDFKVPYLLPDEVKYMQETREKADLEIEDLSSLISILSDFKTLTESMEDISFCPSLAGERAAINDSYMKLKIEYALQLALRDFNRRDQIDLTFITTEVNSLDNYNAHVRKEYETAVQTILIFNSLNYAVALLDRDFNDYNSNRELESQFSSLPGKVSPDFAQHYRDDIAYMHLLYNSFEENEETRSRNNLEDYMEDYYGDLWDIADDINDDDTLDRDDLADVRNLYLELEPDTDFTAPSDELDHFRLSASIGRNPLVSAGFLWQPWKWFGLRGGISLVYDFDTTVDFALPLEVDFFIIQRKFKLYAGLASDLVSITNNPPPEMDSNLILLSKIGVNLGFSLDIGRISIFLNNYLFYLPHVPSEEEPLIYSPSLGILF